MPDVKELPQLVVSIHPPLCRRGEPVRSRARSIQTLFQSTPRFVGEGNSLIADLRSTPMGFNPPPALSARGTRPSQSRGRPQGFQSTPRFVGEGNVPTIGRTAIPWFQSTPRFVGEGNSRSRREPGV